MGIDHAAVERGDERLGALAEDYLKLPGVDWGRMFSTTGAAGPRQGLRAGQPPGGQLMVKVPHGVGRRAGRGLGEGAADRDARAGDA